MKSVAPFGTTSPEGKPAVVSPSWICAAKEAAGRREFTFLAAELVAFVVKLGA